MLNTSGVVINYSFKDHRISIKLEYLGLNLHLAALPMRSPWASYTPSQN